MGTIPRLVEVELLVEKLLFKIRKDQDPPAQARLADGVVYLAAEGNVPFAAS